MFGCASVVPTVRPGSLGPPIALAGRVTYEARSATPHGASAALEIRPARFVLVEAIVEEGTVAASTTADEDGAFAFVAPATARKLVVWAHIRDDLGDLSVSRDAGGRELHFMEVPIEGHQPALSIVARDDVPEGPAGAFHILDTLRRGSEQVFAWTERRLPPFFAYWRRGVTTVWSFYLGERPTGSGRYSIELLGGDPGQQVTTDTDEHDESIILHEFGHFVMDRLSTDSSSGGDHPGGHLLDPGLAWEEGRASWFASSVLASPWYRDTIGLEPGGSLRISHDLERGRAGPLGMGSEDTVAAVLWDLSDGAEGLPDTDQDNVSIGPAVILRTMIAMADAPGAFPCLPTFLRFLVAQGAVPAPAVKHVLALGGYPQSLLPDSDVSSWPRDLGLPDQASGKVDGLTEPAPSGGPNRPDNGFDAMRVYRVRVERRSRLGVRLRIEGSGRSVDRTDLDLELRDLRARPIDSARGQEAREVMSRVLDPGWYLIYVRDGGTGNRAGFALEVWTDAI